MSVITQLQSHLRSRETSPSLYNWGFYSRAAVFCSSTNHTPLASGSGEGERTGEGGGGQRTGGERDTLQQTSIHRAFLALSPSLNFRKTLSSDLGSSKFLTSTVMAKACRWAGTLNDSALKLSYIKWLKLQACDCVSF